MNNDTPAEREAIVRWLLAIDEYHPLAAQLAANCEAPDVDLSWVMPFIARAIERADHLKEQDHD